MNIIRTPGDRMVSIVEHMCVGYYNAISKKKARAHVNERNVVNYIMCLVVTKKLCHVSGDKSLVNPYQKPQRLINRLFELFSNPDDWVLNLFSRTGNLISFINFFKNEILFLVLFSYFCMCDCLFRNDDCMCS